MGKKTKAAETPSVNADEKYQINSFKDITGENLKNVLLNNRYAQMLVVLIAAGFILRFYNLGFNSIWLDEGSTLGFARMSLDELWAATTGGEFNPPLFYIFEHIMLVFGDSEFLLRLLPAVFGTLTIPVIYFIGKEVSGRAAGIIASAIVTFSTFHIYYSQEARAYTTMLFFFSVALLFYIIALKSDSLKHWLIAGIFASLAFWSHFYVFIAIGILILHALIVKRKAIMQDIKSAAPIAACLAAFIICSLPLIIATAGLFFKRTASDPTWGLSGFSVFSQTFVLLSNSEVWLAAVFGILAVIGIIYLYTKENLRDYSYLMALSIILPFIISMILSAKIPMSPRYMIYILPFLCISIGAASGFIPKTIDLKKVAAASIVILLLIAVPYLSAYYTQYSKNDWRGFSGQLSAITNEGDYVVAMPGYMVQPLDYYYDHVSDGTIEKGASSAEELEKIDAERGDSPAYYVITWDISAADPSGGSMQWIENNAEFIGQNMGIYVFRSNQ